jgi:heme exporter protein D
MTAFFEMGGYAFYVWSAYGIAFLLMCLGIILPIIEHKKILRELALKRLRKEGA